MRAVRRAWLIAALLGVSCGAPQPLQPTPQAFIVERVIDGDTLVITDVGTVRLIGVDTPETVHPSRPVERFGAEASAFLRGLVLGKSVHVDYDQRRVDRYGRTLAYVYLLPGMLFVNLEIVRQGYGFAYTAFPFRYMAEFRAAERDARDHSRGLWGP